MRSRDSLRTVINWVSLEELGAQLPGKTAETWELWVGTRLDRSVAAPPALPSVLGFGFCEPGGHPRNLPCTHGPPRILLQEVAGESSFEKVDQEMGMRGTELQRAKAVSISGSRGPSALPVSSTGLPVLPPCLQH